MYDLIIIGGGPAAITAGIYAARKKLNTLLIAKQLGGQMIWAIDVSNYPGLPHTPGADLTQKLISHLKNFEIEIKEGETAEKLSKNGEIFEIKTGKSAYQAKSVIIATGKSPRRLGVPGDDEFEGKGIAYCATCDAPLFQNKTVAVVGAGDAGMDAAWQLTKYADKVYVLNKYEELKSDNVILQEAVKTNDKIEIISNAVPKEIKGGKFVESLVYEQSGETKEIKVSGIFVEIGSVPSSQFAKDLLQLNEKSEIIINFETNSASEKGAFAAGDVTNIREKQMIIAAGEGAKAALSAYDYLKNV